MYVYVCIYLPICCTFPPLCVFPHAIRIIIYEKMKSKHTCVYRTLTDCVTRSISTGRISFELMHFLRCYSNVEYITLSLVTYDKILHKLSKLPKNIIMIRCLRHTEMTWKKLGLLFRKRSINTKGCLNNHLTFFHSDMSKVLRPTIKQYVS